MPTETTFSIEPYWLGKYVSDGHTHTGIVKVTNGSLEMKNNEISSGTFTVDMKTIENFDLPQEKKGYLVGHLNGAEFFNTEKYAQVPVKITGKNGDKLNIELVVLDKTIKTEIPYEVKADGKKVILKSKFMLDFAVLGVDGFKAKEGKPANEKTDTKVDFDLNLVLTK